MTYQDPNSSELEAIRRRRAIAEAMQAQSMQPIEAVQGGKYVVPINPMQGVAKLAQAYFGSQGAASADVDAKKLDDLQKSKRDADIGRISAALTGSPEIQAPGDALGGGPGRPEQGPSQAKIIQALLGAENPKFNEAGLEMQIKAATPVKPQELGIGSQSDWTPESAAEYLKTGDRALLRKASAPGKYDARYVAIAPDAEQQFEVGVDGRVDISKPIGVPRKINSGSSVNVSNVIGKGDSKYVETRLEDAAKKTGKLDDTAAAAWKDVQTLERFLKDSKTGTEGSLQPIWTGMENLLSTFGYSSDQLKSVQAMEAAVADLVVTKMAEMGSHGFTNADRTVLEKSFPRIATDSASREAVAKLLIKAKRNTINEFENRRKEEETSFPALSGRINQPVWFNEYLDDKKLKAAKERYK